MIAMQYLSATELDVLVRYYHDGQSMIDIADIYSKSPQWVSKVHKFALQKLAEHGIPRPKKPSKIDKSGYQCVTANVNYC